MTPRLFFSSILLIVITIAPNCSNPGNHSKAPQQTLAATADTIIPQTDTNTPQETRESPAGKTVQDFRENKTNRIGTIPTGKDAELNQTREAPPVVVPQKKSAPAGPSGYISRSNVILQSEPTANAPKTGSFNIYDQVIILETKMTDDAGNASEVPKWYKVQCSDKKVGWVVARSVTVN